MWSRIGSMRRRKSTGSSRGECWTAAVPERPTAPRNMVPAVRAALPSTRDAQSSVAVSAPSDKAAGGWLLQPSLAALAATYGGDTSARCGDSAVGGTGQPAACFGADYGAVSACGSRSALHPRRGLERRLAEIVRTNANTLLHPNRSFAHTAIGPAMPLTKSPCANFPFLNDGNAIELHPEIVLFPGSCAFSYTVGPSLLGEAVRRIE